MSALTVPSQARTLLDEFSTGVVTEAAGALAALRTPNWLGDSAVSWYALASLIA